MVDHLFVSENVLILGSQSLKKVKARRRFSDTRLLKFLSTVRSSDGGKAGNNEW
jgi:hypothetical protein